MYNYGRLRRACPAKSLFSLALPLSPCLQNPLTVYILQTPTQLTQRTIRSTHPFCHASLHCRPAPCLASLVYRKNLHKVRINYAVEKVIIPYLQYSDETRGGEGRGGRWVARRLVCFYLPSTCPTAAALPLLLLSGVCVPGTHVTETAQLSTGKPSPPPFPMPCSPSQLALHCLHLSRATTAITTQTATTATSNKFV